jgi:hypothetical protein
MIFLMYRKFDGQMEDMANGSCFQPGIRERKIPNSPGRLVNKIGAEHFVGHLNFQKNRCVIDAVII